MNNAANPEPRVRFLSTVGAADLPAVGGKGANLGEMIQAGFPVPPGFCVTTEGFRQFIGNSPHKEAIFASLEAVDGKDLDEARRVGEWVRRQLAAVPVPPDLAREILVAWQKLGVDHAYAVRSSATAEDLPGASFAGQQDTFLNIRGEQELLDSVRRCWISLFTDRAILYRIEQGFSHTDVLIAVVVQQMIDADVSGILFTADPVTGRRWVTVVDASFGLGEALVAGKVSPDQYQVDKRTGQIIGRTIAEKELAIRPRPEGGTYEQSLSGEQRSAGSLTDEQVFTLATIGSRIESHYKQPQDIEWAIEEGKFYILQTRPITSLFPVPKAAIAMAKKTRQLQLMFSFGAVQGMIEPMTRLGQVSIQGAFAGAAGLFGVRDLTPETQRVIWPAAERLFVNFTALARHPIGRKLAYGALKWIEPGVAQSLAPLWEDPRLQPEHRWFRWRTFGRILRFFGPLWVSMLGAIRQPDRRRDSFQRFMADMVDELRRRSENVSTLVGSVGLFEEMMNKGFQLILPRFLPLMAAGMASLNLLIRLAESLPEEGLDALLFTRGLPHNVTTEMDLALWQTAKVIQSDDAARDLFQSCDAEGLARDYLNGRFPHQLSETLAGFLDRYGARGVGEIDIGRPRWREDPTSIMQVLQSYLHIEDESKAPDSVFARGAAEAEAAVEPFLAALEQTRGGRFKARLASMAIRRVRALSGLRESPKFLMMQLFGIIRESILSAGRELVQVGKILHADDLFFLELKELKSLAAGENGRWIEVVAGRRRIYEREKKRSQIPRLLLSDGHAFYEGVRDDSPAEEGQLVGSPVSPGAVEGLVRVVFDPHETQLSPGEILVCHGTDPAWTPLFLAAGGLVMEVGGLMTHGSVVAREYGIPAVAGVHQATSRLRTGQRVKVDGSVGRITILAEIDS